MGMYVGIDIGGTKTLVGILNNDGVIREQVKFPTPQNYDEFLEQLGATLQQFKEHDFKAGGVGLPATELDRRHGRAVSFANLKWHNVDITHDISRLTHCPMVMDNDAKMAGLSEALLLKSEFSRVLYVTVSTGIGIAFIVDGVIDDNIGDGGGKTMLVEHHGKHVPWESFASGRAMVERYGKRAVDIQDAETWTKVSRDLAKGLIELIALTEPEVIVFGGGVGTYFDRYGKILKKELQEYDLPIIHLPELRGAQRAETAVVYGCYDLAKRVYSHA